MRHEAADAVLIEPEPAAPAPWFPLYMVGCGGYDLVFAVTRVAGWIRYTDAGGDNHTDVSPDERLSVEFGPEADAPPITPLWRIAYRNPDFYQPRANSWSAYFDGDTPAEAIAAFLVVLTNPSLRPGEPLSAQSASGAAS